MWAIKSDSEREQVQGKVDYSMNSLGSLSSDRSRWESGSRTFEAEVSMIVGDVLLSATFLWTNYEGFFDQHSREVMAGFLYYGLPSNCR